MIDIQQPALMNIQNGEPQQTPEDYEKADENPDASMQEVMNLLETKNSSTVFDKGRMTSPSFALIDPQNSLKANE